MKAIFLCLASLVATSLMVAQDAPATKPAWQLAAEKQVAPLLEKKQLNVVMIGVIDRTGKKHFLALGDKPDTLTSLDEHTIFEIGSISKTMTSMMLADGVQRMELKLDDPVQNYLPQGMVMPRRGDHVITMEDLATHTSGLPRLAPLQMSQLADPKVRANPYATMNAEQLKQALAEAKAKETKPPSPAYSNFGVSLLGYVLCQKYGKDYGALVKERVFEPVGMTESWLVVPETEKARFIDGFDANGKLSGHWDFTDVTAGAGGIRSTTHDMLLYVEAGMGRSKGLRIAFDVALHPQYEMGRQGHIGLGWLLGEMEGKRFAWHNGGTGGFSTFCAFCKSPGVGVVVLSNRSKPGGEIDRLGMTVLRELLK